MNYLCSKDWLHYKIIISVAVLAGVYQNIFHDGISLAYTVAEWSVYWLALYLAGWCWFLAKQWKLTFEEVNMPSDRQIKIAVTVAILSGITTVAGFWLVATHWELHLGTILGAILTGLIFLSMYFLVGTLLSRGFEKRGRRNLGGDHETHRVSKC
jgi:peptidoglycan biosynthesis protein MviN/MurJ (putative lipid II flippase)